MKVKMYKIARIHDTLDTSLTVLKQLPLNETLQTTNFFEFKFKATRD